MTIDEILDGVVAREGGYVNDPNDPGGETKFGISKKAHPNVDIKNLTREGALAIYKSEYVEKPGFLQVSDDKLREQLVDFGVNSGPKRAISFLQELLEVPVTGVLDGTTLATLWGLSPLALSLLRVALAGLRAKFLDQLTDGSPKMKKFEEGLESRALSFIENEVQ